MEENGKFFFFFFNPDQCPLLLAFSKAPNSNDLLRGGGGQRARLDMCAVDALALLFISDDVHDFSF